MLATAMVMNVSKMVRFFYNTLANLLVDDEVLIVHYLVLKDVHHMRDLMRL